MSNDEQLRLDVLAELEWDPRVPDERIGVIVKDGTVTLTGSAASYAEKRAAERAAARVEHVRAVINEVEVLLPVKKRHDDEALADRIGKLLKWNAALRKASIRAQVAEGHVTLAGEVDWPYQRQMAAQRVEELDGVLGISNEISVRKRGAGLTSAHVREQILAALQRHATIGATRIRVSVNDGRVALAGVVDAIYERKLIEDAVWCTAGVKEVVDQLSIR